jgi:hypothetical protein
MEVFRMSKPSNVFTLSHIYLTKTGPVSIGGITDLTPSSGVAHALLRNDGEAAARYSFVAECNPTISFTSNQIATLLALNTYAFATKGLTLASSCLATCWFQAVQQGGLRQTGATARPILVNEGILVPRKLSVRGNAPATLSCDIVTTYDGTNLPFVLGDAAAMAGTAGASTAYVVGPVDLGGTNLEGIDMIDIDFGLRLEVLHGDGVGYPLYVFVADQEPVIELSSSDASVLHTLGLIGSSSVAADTHVHLRKAARGGLRTADATAEHVKISMYYAQYYVTGVKLDGAVMRPGIRIVPTHDDNAAHELLTVALAAI